MSPPPEETARPDGLTVRIAAFICEGTRPPPGRLHHAKRHMLDTLAAIVSGAGLPAGQIALADILLSGDRQEATVAGAAKRFPVQSAAYANAMAAHADETDDAHPASVTHPGCAVVPAALAMAESRGATGAEMLAAIVIGYEICARIGTALGGGRFIVERGFDSHSFGAVFGAAAAAATLAKLDRRQCQSVLSLAAHQAAGLATLFRDREHLEKAFVFAGMPARNGVAAVLSVERGLVGVDDVFDGSPSFFSAFGADPEPAFADLGSRWAIENTNIKRWCVGSPVQAALDSLKALMSEHGVGPDDIAAIEVSLPEEGASVVDDRDMPNVNLQHLIALMLVDGTVTFHNAHDRDRMSDERILAERRKVRLIGSPELTRAEPARQAIVELATHDGRTLRHHTRAVRGTVGNPMTDSELEAKFLGLVEPVLKRKRAGALAAAAWQLDKADNVEHLCALMNSAA
ncbi:MAG: MmgE/PrpD family protein [Hyphomicrobiales bacterium]|nr:MmgE/PrpD family protein [Hyphomicrobiales bacterium]